MNEYVRDWDSIINQDIKNRFVGQHVDGCYTTEVEYILSRWDHNDAPYTMDDIEHYYVPHCEDCGEGYTTFEEGEDEYGDTVYKCVDCDRVYSQDEYDDLDTQPQEIYEWWSVSSYLAERLSEYGECVLRGPLTWYWGRCCTGQAILLDGVVSRICEDMEILYGQIHSWAKEGA